MRPIVPPVSAAFGLEPSALALFLLLWAAATAAVGSTALSFQPPVHLPAGKAPMCVLIADLNHDGKADLLVANAGSSNLSVYLGDGHGRFFPAKGAPFPAGPSPNDMALGHFNGDAHLDVAIANHGIKLVTVLLGDGNGGFSPGPGSPLSVASAPHPHGVALGDFNGDKKLDFAVESWAENKVLVMFGNGDGTFQTPGLKVPTGKMPYQRLRSADLNGDGNPDIITSNFEDSSLSILLGDGKGSFALLGGTNIPVPPRPFGLAIGDFNGDHHPDIAVVHYSGQGADRSKNGLSILFGDGRGNFTLAKGSPLPVGHYPVTLCAADLNGDGISDIAVPNAQDNTVTIYLGGKDGIHQPEGSPIRVGRRPQSVAIADLNGDGKPDLVVANSEDNDLWVLFSK